MRFGSVCSGIEAASVAWHFWDAAWFSEIEPFPCAVLKHHYPEVPNHGDMTTLPDRILSGEVGAPDVFCGGTPCQAFSVAGNRKSLDDARGNLSLTFCEIADAIDAVRYVRNAEPAIIFWENVPGVLNTTDNAFGCFLGKLAGESCELQPPGGRWTDAGVVHGPQRTIAWRVLDAQYFGLAQRRRRVFVVASSRKGFNPSEVLFEFDSLRRDTAPSRQAGQGIAAYAETGVVANRMTAFGEYVADDTASTLKMRDYKDATDLICAEISPIAFGGQMSTPQVDFNLSQTLQAKNPQAVATIAPPPCVQDSRRLRRRRQRLLRPRRTGFHDYHGSRSTGGCAVCIPHQHANPWRPT